MKITDIYTKYEIPPNLADHQLTVSAVASTICKLTGKGDATKVITACLLHAMGHIIKFRFEKKIRGAEMENVEHWKVVQQKLIDTYGSDEHVATMAIVAEIGVESEIIDVLDAAGFRQSLDTLQSGDESKMIAAYSDMRVAPHGVVSLQERLDDLTARYDKTDDREQYNEAFKKIEAEIFAGTDVHPKQVSPERVEAEKAELRSFAI
ncbi:hypothetical protein KC722_03240 [Candidatus Kaiserbacteria bacterium]|nr:hypothetical protein [Candidatus Kaiserbacteria bacterium]MCB9811975.1 hypothetical protein [Candidatus Nomurabacteria bacterium]